MIDYIELENLGLYIEYELLRLEKENETKWRGKKYREGQIDTLYNIQRKILKRQREISQELSGEEVKDD